MDEECPKPSCSTCEHRRIVKAPPYIPATPEEDRRLGQMTLGSPQVAPYSEQMKSTESAFDQQVAGSHYKDLGIQPLELTLRNRGYVAFAGACYTKIVKYMDRKKDNEVEQLKKAAHVLAMWIEQAEKENE